LSRLEWRHYRSISDSENTWCILAVPTAPASGMTPTSPRFRIRDPEGREVEIPSVEDLADRIVAGEVGPDTPLFDAGTGQWNPAGTVPVFQFVVEELRAEGRLEPEESPSSDADGDLFEGGSGDRADDPLILPGLPLTPDPFELHLPLRSTIPGAEESPEEGEGDALEELESGPPPEWTEELMEGLDEGLGLVGEVEEESSEEKATDSRRTEPEVRPPDTEGITWGLPLPSRTPDPDQPATRVSEDPPFADTPPDEEEDAPPPFPLERERSPRRPRRERTDPVEDGISADPWGTVGPPRHADGDPPEALDVDPPKAPPRPEAVRPVGRRRDRRMLATFGISGVLILLLASVVLLSSDEVTVPMVPPAGPAVQETAPGLTGLMAVVPPPPGLEPFTEQLVRGLSSELGHWTDSLRVEAGLSTGPPPGWLGGFYLSHAGDFPAVPEFWRQYRDFLEDLRELDQEGYREAVLRVVEREDLPGVDPDEVGLYFEERYAVLGSLRDDRYAQLVRVAEVAEELHHFLAEAQDRIAHAPAVGQGISPDPILEAVPRDEETRLRLDQLLDSLFQALDRSRGGGAPSFEGLRTELYGRFGHPV
jgi:hypothetical protein